MSTLNQRRPLVALALLPASLISLSVHAQDGTATLEEIIVTAQKREQSLQDVPISMTAMGPGELAAGGYHQLRDVQFSVPNLVFGSNQAQSETFIGIRGVGDFARNMGFDSRVGVYVDGAFVGQSVAANAELLGVERIEVLRGPQGSLFGKNTVSGAISITTRKPSDEFSTEATVEYGNYDLQALRARVNVPLGDALALQLSGFGRTRDGYVDNVFLDRDIYNANDVSGRAQLRWRPSDVLDVNLSFDVLSEHRRSLFLEATDGLGYIEAPRKREVSFDVDIVDHRDLSGLAASVDYDFGEGFRLTSISSYRDARRRNNSDEDASSLDVLWVDLRNEWRHFTQELRIASPTQRDLSYLAGLYYFTQTTEGEGEAVGGALFPQPGYHLRNFGEVKTDAWAAFAHANWRMSERWTAGLGVRYTVEEKRIVYSQQDAEPLFPSFDRFTDKLDDEDFSPSLDVQFRATGEVLVYGRVARGYKSGGWNADFVSSTEIAYGAEEALSYEFGVKSELADRRVRLNVATFYTKFDDFQVFQFQALPNGGTNLVLTNAGKVTTQGAEVELQAQITSDLSLSASAGFTQAEYDEFRNGGGVGVHFDGNRLVNAPRFNGAMSASYSTYLGSGLQLAARGEYTYKGDVFYNPNNLPNTSAPGFGLFNARLALIGDSERWEAAVWGRNLGDKTYLENRGESFLGVPFVLYGSPRTYGVELTMRY